MLQIVHDVAPDAELYFRSGFISAGNFAEGIKVLRDSGCNVIVDDITYLTEPFFSDGVVAKAVEEVTASGVNYFTSAGNFGIKSYEGVFSPTPAPAGYVGVAHDFGAGNYYQNLNLPAGTYTLTVVNGGQTSNGATFRVRPYILSASASSGLAGDSVTLTGTNYGSSATTSVVMVGSTNATITAWTASSTAT